MVSTLGKLILEAHPLTIKCACSWPNAASDLLSPIPPRPPELFSLMSTVPSVTVLALSGNSTPSLSSKSSSESIEKKKFDQVVVTTAPVEEDGLEDIDGGWEGYMDSELPEKSGRKFVRNVRHHLLNIYRRLFSIVFLVNTGVLISFAVRGTSTPHLGLVVIANIFTAVVIREEHVSRPARSL